MYKDVAHKQLYYDKSPTDVWSSPQKMGPAASFLTFFSTKCLGMEFCGL